MPTTTVRQDDDNLYNWDTIISTFDDIGVLESRFLSFDDGTIRSESYEGGVLRQLDLADPGSVDEPNGVKSWDRIEITYDANGDLEGRYQLNDNGIQILQDYDAGVLRQKTEVDFGPGGQTSDVAIWETRYTYYDAQGQLESRFETRDDGVQILNQYENGVRRSQEQVDLGDNGEASDARIWERINTYYDEDGQLETRFEQRDDGVQILSQYDAGTIRSVEQVDLTETGGASDARIWERRDTYYDENGQLETRFEQRDDGVEILTQYENGVRRSVEQVDLTDTGGASDARIWEQIDTFYDENGVVEFQFETRDNGVTIETEYENGQKRQVTKMDQDASGQTSDAEVWDTILYLYGADGQLEARDTLYDNGDATAFFYQDGNRTARYDLDGDNSEAWQSREILYNADGTVAEINYDVLGDQPSAGF